MKRLTKRWHRLEKKEMMQAEKALMEDLPVTALYYPSFIALVNEDNVENVELTLENSFMFRHAEVIE